VPSARSLPSGAGGATQTCRCMAERQDEPWTQLATRIPKPLHRELKLYCVQEDVRLMDFVVAAIREKLAPRKRAARAK